MCTHVYIFEFPITLGLVLKGLIFMVINPKSRWHCVQREMKFHPHLSLEKWKNASDGEVEEYYNQRHPWKFDKDEGSDYDYYRRSHAYDEIWRMCETYLCHEEEVVYISMFGGYEIAEQIGFVNKCRKAYDEWNRRAE